MAKISLDVERTPLRPKHTQPFKHTYFCALQTPSEHENSSKHKGRIMGLKSYVVEMVPFAAMVIVESLDVGLSTLSKAAMSKGMSHFVIVVYSNALATLILFPFAFIFERTNRSPLSFSLLCKFFLLSMIGITVMQNCVFTGIGYSSPTLGSAMCNLIPAFTFLLAVIFRMEKLNLRSSRSQIKIMGTLVSITGALIVTLYKGPPIGSVALNSFSPSSETSHQPSKSFSFLLGTRNNWVIGGLFLATGSLCVSLWIISQAALLKGYPSELTIVAFYCLFGSIQSAAVSLMAERNNPNAWKLSPDIELITIIYSAVFGSVVTFCAQTWCIRKKGPVFVAMFKPLSIGIAAMMSIIILGDTLHVGTVIGAAIIIIGFYGVIWAKFKENEENETCEVDALHSSALNKPLLQSHRDA